MTPPYRKTGKAMIDALLYTCHVYGGTAISYKFQHVIQNGVLTFTINDHRRSLPITPSTRPIEVIELIQQQVEKETSIMKEENLGLPPRHDLLWEGGE